VSTVEAAAGEGAASPGADQEARTTQAGTGFNRRSLCVLLF